MSEQLFETRKDRRRLDPDFKPLQTLGRLLLIGLVAGLILGVGASLLPGVRVKGTTGDGSGEAMGVAIGVSCSIAFLRFLALWIMSYAEPGEDVAKRRKQIKRSKKREKLASKANVLE